MPEKHSDICDDRLPSVRINTAVNIIDDVVGYVKSVRFLENGRGVESEGLAKLVYGKRDDRTLDHEQNDCARFGWGFWVGMCLLRREKVEGCG